MSPVTGGAIPGADAFMDFLAAYPGASIGQQTAPLTGAQLASASGEDVLLGWVPGVAGAAENGWSNPDATTTASGASDALIVFAIAAAALWWWWR